MQEQNRIFWTIEVTLLTLLLIAAISLLTQLHYLITTPKPITYTPINQTAKPCTSVDTQLNDNINNACCNYNPIPQLRGQTV